MVGQYGIFYSIFLLFLMNSFTVFKSTNTHRTSRRYIDPSENIINITYLIEADICTFENYSYLITSYPVITERNSSVGKRSIFRLDRHYSRSTFRTVFVLCLLRCGDIQCNPGPTRGTSPKVSKSKGRQPKNPCTVCGKGVIQSSKAVNCDQCHKWTHIRCTGSISSELYDQIYKQQIDTNFNCNSCTNMELPFFNLDRSTEELDDVGPNSSSFLPPYNSNHFQCFAQKGLHFIHLNARSLLPKMTELNSIAQKSKASIISITETWLDNSVSDAEIHIPGFSVIRRDRNRQGGGVCVYINNNFAFNTRSDLNTEGTEFLFIELLLPRNKPIYIGTVYRPPSQTDFNVKFENVLKLLRSDCEIIILGDMNICTLQKTSSMYKEYISMLKVFDLVQLIVEPTRIGLTRSSILDHILCNNKENISQSGVISIGLSDHSLIFCTRKIGKIRSFKHNTLKIRSLKNYNKDVLVQNLLHADWHSCFMSKNVNSAWCSFRNIFLNILDKVAPVKEVRLKSRTEPWLNVEILEYMKSRDVHLRNFKKHGNQDDYKQFLKLRNIVQRSIKKAKSEYFSNKVEENRFEPKKLWQSLKSLGYKNAKKDCQNIVLSIEDEMCHDSLKICSHFNNFFTSIASVLVQKLPCEKHKFGLKSNLLSQFYKDRNPDDKRLHLKHVSEDFVYRELCGLNVSKSTGLDGLPARFLRDGADVLKLPITFIVNLSISEGVVPDDFKQARVKPLHKKNSTLDVGNYRPVSILCIVSKILERAVYIQLESFLVSNNMIYDFQSGFRKSYSTDSCLIHLLDSIKWNTSKGLFTGMIMLDLQKAFDTVNHNILFGKLQLMGVQSIPWFKSYLSGRSQIVSIGKTMSDANPVTCGVPQGSILGPLLFLCYVNDMVTSIDDTCKLILYADDSTILFSHENPEIISVKLGQVLENCSDWLVDNKLSLHLGKTEYILFGPKRKLCKLDPIPVNCNGHNINGTREVKYLGMFMDNFLSGEAIVQNIISKVNGKLKFLYRQNSCLDFHTRKLLCSALLQCHFDYSSTSWFEGINKGLKNKLQIMQNKIIRFIKGYTPRQTITWQDYVNLNMLNVANRVKQLRLSHMHRVFYKTCPSYLSSHFTINTRCSQLNFMLPTVKNNIDKHTFSYTGCKDWNSLPQHIKSTKNINQFKYLVKTYLLDKQVSDCKNDFMFY